MTHAPSRVCNVLFLCTGNSARSILAHWGAPDPARCLDPEEAKQVVRTVFHLLHRRISLLTRLPVDELDRLALQAETRAIAQQP